MHENHYFCTMNKRILFLIVLTVVLVSVDAYSQGCSQCKLVAEQASGAEEASFGSNINYGILYLMAMPYLLIMFLFRKRIFQFFRGLLNRA